MQERFLIIIATKESLFFDLTRWHLNIDDIRRLNVYDIRVLVWNRSDVTCCSCCCSAVAPIVVTFAALDTYRNFSQI
jgi:hypothetical protein